MRMLIVIGLVTLSTTTAAQEPTQLQASLSSRAPLQPVARHGLALGSDPSMPARGWATRPDADGDAELPGIVSTFGPGVRITTASDVTVFRPEWKLAGNFTVSAVFQRQPSSSASSSYGLTVGGERGMAFLVRADGAFAVQPVGLDSLSRSWSPVALRQSIDGTPPMNRLEVRVGSTEAAFLINGTVVMTIAIGPGQLDGVPGVHAGALADVAVAGFAVQSAVTLLSPNTTI